MSSTRRLLNVVALLAPLAAAACASGGTPTAQPAPTGPVVNAEGLSAAEMEAVFQARTDSMRSRWTEADAKFMRDMIHHHAQALEMSRMAEANGASPTIVTLADRITNAQRDEIALMQTWLRRRGLPAPELHVTDDHVMVHMAGGEHDDHSAMPGMLTQEQLSQLKAARGRAFDRLFLELMIQHHRGAVVMVDELFATDGALQDEDAFRFASDVQVDQRTEIARMELMLSSMGGS